MNGDYASDIASLQPKGYEAVECVEELHVATL